MLSKKLTIFKMFFRKKEPTITKEGIDLIKFFEGCPQEDGMAVSYRCAANKPTIGFGSLHLIDGSKVQDGMKITLNEAEELLKHELERFEKDVKELVTVELNEDQLSSLIAFTFNVGKTSLSISTLLKKLNASDYDAVPDQIRRWNKATVNGKKVVLDGLVARREAEALLFQSKPWR